MNETLEDNINTTPPKKLKEKLRDESPKKDSYAGSPSKEVLIISRKNGTVVLKL